MFASFLQNNTTYVKQILKEKIIEGMELVSSTGLPTLKTRWYHKILELTKSVYLQSQKERNPHPLVPKSHLVSAAFKGCTLLL